MIHRLIPFAVALLAACASMTPAGPKVSAALVPTAGNKAAGSVTFTPNGDRVRVVAKVTGLPPGAHDFHIHEKGDCSAADGMSAGGHFNPTSKPHGNPSAGEHHGGDMTMLEADAAGNATLDATLDTVTLGSDANTSNNALVWMPPGPDGAGDKLLVHSTTDGSLPITPPGAREDPAYT